MKKSITLLFAVIFVLSFQSGVFCQPEDLVPNGGFEKKGADTIAEGWKTKVYRGTEVEFALDEQVSHSGNFSFRASFNEKGGSALLYPANDIGNVAPGQTYEISLWIKAQNLGYSPNFIAPAVRFNFQPTRVHPHPAIDLMSEMRGIKEWKRLTTTATAPPDAETSRVQVMLTKGTIWIDDISITPVDEE
ncbi:MAG: carbohydrate binding domain-containing protein [Desulfobacterales bacterium]|nr:carbohydrate binding domain-containing protein [Desulfobacterales bacterium]